MGYPPFAVIILLCSHVTVVCCIPNFLYSKPLHALGDYFSWQQCKFCFQQSLLLLYVVMK